jgi:hypothetical protein
MVRGSILPVTWNARSTLINPVVVFAVSVLLMYTKHQEESALYLTPIGFLAINSVACFSFWALRLARNRSGLRRSCAFAVGYASRFIGWLGFLALLALLLGAILGRTVERSELSMDTDPKFWIFWGWAMFEAVHHHIYKLTFGFRDTLQYVVEGGNWNQLARPLGGAIGVQLRRLRRRIR